MKIYTKGGDKGTTSLFGGTRVPKYHIRLEAYGTVDELNAHIALLRDSVSDRELEEILLQIQYRLMSVCASLANETVDKQNRIPEINEGDIVFLESQIDLIDSQLEPLKSFVIPGGHPVASICHIARTVCRRSERNIVKLSEEVEVSELIIKYINRLSDYLFILSRKLVKIIKKMKFLGFPICNE
ncbi:MAG: cob(I)yrinic acid a,c-diamide adenosyltransferase [Bacteroidales bacterium]|nr:cob(I)yrinic acid a,c-diamide adenosyltransferase [Bacteroidales bacterium]